MKLVKTRILTIIMAMMILVTNMSYAIFYDVSENVIPLNDVRTTVVSNDTVSDTGIMPYSAMKKVSNVRSSDNPKVTYATICDDLISIKGYVGNKEFFVTGVISGISENRCLIAYDAADKTNNFDIVFCAVEKNLDEAILYFDDENIMADDTVIKLYLKEKNFTVKENKYVMIEVFNKEFPVITDEIIKSLPEDSDKNLYWYAREFKPIEKGIKDVSTTRAGNPSYIQLGYYEYNHLGMTISHYLQYRQDTNIRDVTYNGSSFASADNRSDVRTISVTINN